MLSINGWNMLFTVINVLILFFLIKKFLFKPVHRILDQRKAEIDQAFAESENTRKEADALKAKYETAVEGMEEERKKSVADARREAREKAERIIEDAHRQSDDIIEEARKKGAAAAEQERCKGEEMIAEMVRTAAAKIVNSTSDEQMFEEFLKEAEREAALQEALGNKEG